MKKMDDVLRCFLRFLIMSTCGHCWPPPFLTVTLTTLHHPRPLVRYARSYFMRFAACRSQNTPETNALLEALYGNEPITTLTSVFFTARTSDAIHTTSTPETAQSM